MWMQAIGSWPSSYVYSAYIDDRPAADVSHLIEDSRPLLRVFSWIPRQMPATCHWRCLFWHREHNFPLERPVITWTDLDHLDSNRPYVTAELSLTIATTFELYQLCWILTEFEKLTDMSRWIQTALVVIIFSSQSQKSRSVICAYMFWPRCIEFVRGSVKVCFFPIFLIFGMKDIV